MYGLVGSYAPHLIDTLDRFIAFTEDGSSPALRVEPVELALVKKQRRFTSVTLDDLFLLWIAAARSHLEEETGRQLITATWEYWLDRFPWNRQIEIPHPPLQSIVSVKYDNGAGVEQTLDPTLYRLIAENGEYCSRGRIALVTGASWPSTASQPKAVRIQYRAGYGDSASAIPARVSYALMMLVGHFHKFSEEVNEARANILQLPIGAQNVIMTMKYKALPMLPPLMSHWWPLGPYDGPYGDYWGTPWR